MRTVPRTRHYVSPGALTICRPLLSFDYARGAYVLRGIGDRIGPVLREDRRRASEPGAYTGPERRGFAQTRLSDVPGAVHGTSRDTPETRSAGPNARRASRDRRAMREARSAKASSARQEDDTAKASSARQEDDTAKATSARQEDDTAKATSARQEGGKPRPAGGGRRGPKSTRNSKRARS